jgi:hypothetical protein
MRLHALSGRLRALSLVSQNAKRKDVETTSRLLFDAVVEALAAERVNVGATGSSGS